MCLLYLDLYLEIKDFNFFCSRMHFALAVFRISHVSKPNMNKWHCCHCSAICRLLPAFGVAFLPLSTFSILSFFSKVFSFVPLHWVCFFHLSLITSRSQHQNRFLFYFFLNKNTWSYLGLLHSVCSIQWTYSCIERKIEFKCEFCFGWNARCHYYILGFILTNLWFLGAVTSCILAARNVYCHHHNYFLLYATTLFFRLFLAPYVLLEQLFFELLSITVTESSLYLSILDSAVS